MEIIAELGSNPAGYGWQTAGFVWAAAEAGATAVKVQLFQAEHFPAIEQKSKRALEFPRNQLERLKMEAHALGLKFGASAFDLDAIILTARTLDFVKLAAREQANYDLIMGVLNISIGLPIYRSIDTPRHYLDYKYFTTLGTVQRYPLGMGAALIRAVYWAAFFRLQDAARWGWSSHTRGILDCVLAARLGAQVIEKHLCLARADVEGEHSLLPAEFSRMVRAVNK